MSQEKSTRPLAEIQQEYQNLCARAGHLQYSVVTFQKDLELVNQTLRDLNFEAAAASKAKAEPAPQAAESVSESAVEV